ncbi:hypothetical protein F0A17_05710 [Billgrantia pellis]|uniref:Uncharacterized protein n=1 Tax=Billgrantia pellis TaxID=2606936 RepID=A0A7V7G3D0_9GAMM|nr:hypothetical protein [Halomonas pellis]KAA0013838.1 hypothetical protein F0A17_05710 [Halomonas pellis]
MDERWRLGANHGRKWHSRPGIEARAIQAREAETRRGRARRLLMGVLASWLLLLLMALLCAYWLLLYLPETNREAPLPLDEASVVLHERGADGFAIEFSIPLGRDE